MEENKINIFEKYGHEINSIRNLLIDLENGRVYEVERKPGIPRCSTLADRLREEISDLLIKINNNDKGFDETIAEVINNLKL